MPDTYRLLRDSIPVRLEGRVLEDEHVIYAVRFRKVQYATELLRACWHMDRWSLNSTSIYVLRDEQDWFLFKVANAITEYQMVELV